MDRERGTETSPCPSCGAALAVVELAPGQRTTVLCAACYGGGVKEKAAEAFELREFGAKAPVVTKKEEVEEDD